MTESLIFSFNAVLPLVLLTLLGYALRRLNVISEAWAAAANTLCYKLFLPTLLFINIYNTESLSDVALGPAAFACAGILLACGLGWLFVKALPNRGHKGVVMQCAFRSNFSILGLPLAISLYGTAGGQTAAMLSLFSIPLYNVLAIIILRYYGPVEGTENKSILKEIAKNPLILAILAGLLALVARLCFVEFGVSFRLKNITFLYSALSSVSQVTTPLALIALGAQFSFRSVRGLIKPLAIGTALRLIVVPALLLTVAYAAFPGFYGADFAALIALFASPMAVSSTVMTAELGGDIELAGQLLFWTTAFSAITVFLFVLVFKSLGAL